MFTANVIIRVSSNESGKCPICGVLLNGTEEFEAAWQ
jgi:hypothetical protein